LIGVNNISISQQVGGFDGACKNIKVLKLLEGTSTKTMQYNTMKQYNTIKQYNSLSRHFYRTMVSLNGLACFFVEQALVGRSKILTKDI
jgi:hypothetical protein